MHPLFLKGQEHLRKGEYEEAKYSFSELMYCYEDVTLDQYPKILEYLHLTLIMDMVNYFQEAHPDIAGKVHDYLVNNTCYREHLSSPDFDKLEKLLSSDSL
jgi:hypothetical protein